jgi:hypothetical protein
MECGRRLATSKPEAHLQDTGSSRAIEHAWLCSACCRDMTLYIDDDDRVMVVRRAEAEWSRIGERAP